MLAYPQTSCGRVGGIHSACHPKKRGNIIISLYTSFNIVQELWESRGGRPGLSVLTSLLVSVDVKIYWTVLRHWSQLVPNMSTDIWETLSINSSTSFNFIMFGRTWVLGKWSQFYSVLERWAKDHNFILYWVLGLFKHPKVYVPRMQRHAQHEQSCHSQLLDKL